MATVIATTVEGGGAGAAAQAQPVAGRWNHGGPTIGAPAVLYGIAGANRVKIDTIR